MAIQLGTTVRNNRLDSIETTVSTSPILEIWSGALPANCAAADAGSKISNGALPSDWLAAAAAGSKAKLGTWTLTGLAAAGAGTAGVYWRIKDSSATTTHMQGTLTVTGGGGDMTVDNVNIANAQVTTVTGFTLTDGNA